MSLLWGLFVEESRQMTEKHRKQKWQSAGSSQVSSTTGLIPPDTDLLPPHIFVLVNNYPIPNALWPSHTFSIKCLTESTTGLIWFSGPYRGPYFQIIFLSFSTTHGYTWVENALKRSFVMWRELFWMKRFEKGAEWSGSEKIPVKAWKNRENVDHHSVSEM